jgi:hypothetical protein
MFSKISQHIQSTFRRANPILKRAKTTLIIGAFSWNTTPKALAQEVKIPNQQHSVCQEKQVNDREYQKPSALKIQKIASHLDHEDIESSEQGDDSCQSPETSEISESSKPLGTLETSSNENLNDSPSDTVSYDNDSINPDRSTSTQPSISDTDSHDSTISIQVNVNGGTSSGSGGSFPESEPSYPSEVEAVLPEASMAQPTTDGNFSPSRLKPHHKKPKKLKHHKEKHHKLKKPHRSNKGSKHGHPKRPNHKPKKHFLKKPIQTSKPVKKIETNHRKTVKRPQNLKIRDRLLPIRKKSNSHKVRPKLRPNIRSRKVFKPAAPRFHRHRHVR